MNYQGVSDVGILAIELYVPYQYVDQTELEVFDGVSLGKYTIGLGQGKMGFCSDREDINSLCLTAVRNLMEKHEISYDRIGRLEVGTETILDKSKSVKSVLMQLFEESGNSDIEGLDTTNACYGGTAAIFNSVNWIESSAWDGRLALAVAGDIAIYSKGAARPTGGAGAVAILIGPNAPLVFERGTRTTHAAHVYDFYKPDMDSEYPRVDGQLSIQCYFSALDKCYQGLIEKAKRKNEGDNISLDSFQAIIFHSPYCKLVQKSFARLLLNDVHRMDEAQVAAKFPQLESVRSKKLEETYFDRDVEKIMMTSSQQLFNEKTKASLHVANQVGNFYTGSTYGGLASYLSSKELKDLKGERLCLFSYGSGLQASIYTMKIRTDADDQLKKLLHGVSTVRQRLDSRQKVKPEKFANIMSLREETHDKAPYEPVGNIQHLFPGTYYMASKDEMHRRQYKRVEKS